MLSVDVNRVVCFLTCWVQRLFVVFMVGLFFLIAISTHLVAESTSFDAEQYRSFGEGGGANYGLEKEILKQAYQSYLDKKGDSSSDLDRSRLPSHGFGGFEGRYEVGVQDELDVDDTSILEKEAKNTKKGFSFGRMATRVSKKKESTSLQDESLFFDREKGR